MGETLPPSAIQALLDEFSPPDAVGAALLGSFARGEGGRFSDIDLNFFVPEGSETPTGRAVLKHRSSRLVSLKCLTVEQQLAALADPPEAVWAVPGVRQMRVLADPHGSLAELKAAAAAFDWGPLEAAADRFVSFELAHTAEEVYKLLGGLEARDPSKTAYATLGVGLSLSGAVAVHRRLLVESENGYFALLQASLGRTSAWSQAHRAAVGWGAGGWRQRGAAALRLYAETFRLTEPVLMAEHLEVIRPALAAIQRPGAAK